MSRNLPHAYDLAVETVRRNAVAFGIKCFDRGWKIAVVYEEVPMRHGWRDAALAAYRAAEVAARFQRSVNDGCSKEVAPPQEGALPNDCEDRGGQRERGSLRSLA